MTAPRRNLTVFAPAKINLFLHVTGRRDDGYHLLQSLVAFADIGDQIRITPATDFTFSAQGPYARAFTARDTDSSPDSSNLVVRAAWGLARLLKRQPLAAITLVKNLPLASGLGGGSADAAATIWGLMELWGIDPAEVEGLEKLMLELGADVPACFLCQPLIMEGIGDEIYTARIDEMPVVLVNPGVFCPTPRVFTGFHGRFAEPIDCKSIEGEDLITFLRAQDNMLTESAVSVAPEIAFALDALAHQEGCRLARMSGSGATCFGLFDDEDQARDAVESIMTKHPQWWVRAGILNRPERY